MLFTKKQIILLIIPLIIEQLLNVAIGMVDIAMVSAVNEVQMSGVSLVDSINQLMVNLFSSLATGGAVVCARYLGMKREDKACSAADQLVLATTVISMVVMSIALIGNRILLKFIFGDVDDDIMSVMESYFFCTSLAYPFLALYNGGAAICRTMGNSKISMQISVITNIVHIIGNAIFIYVLKMGATGVGISTLLTRVCGAAMMIYIVRNPELQLHISRKIVLKPNTAIIKEILGIGVPNGLENSMFQIGKLMISSLNSSFGKTAIAATAVSNTLTTFATIPGSGIGLSFITVIGQCVGAKEYEQAKQYLKRLMGITVAVMSILNIILCIFTIPLVSFYNLSIDAEILARQLFLIHGVFATVVWSFSFALPNALRAAGDVKYTMVVAMFSMWVFRIGFSYILGDYLALGAIGIWIAMIIDWFVRSGFFIVRIKNGKWLAKAKAKAN
jgi:putative efflux protein, MATE family